VVWLLVFGWFWRLVFRFSFRSFFFRFFAFLNLFFLILTLFFLSFFIEILKNITSAEFDAMSEPTKH